MCSYLLLSKRLVASKASFMSDENQVSVLLSRQRLKSVSTHGVRGRGETLVVSETCLLGLVKLADSESEESINDAEAGFTEPA